MPPKGTKKNKIPPSTSTDIINFNRAKKVANTRSTKKKPVLPSSSSSSSRSSSSNSIRQPVNEEIHIENNQEILIKIYEDASNSIFSKKVFMVGEKEHKLTPIFNFFTSPTKFAIKPTKKIVHKCMICGKTIQDEFGYSSNINHHLRHHTKNNIALKNWYVAFEKHKFNNNEIENNLDQHTMDLVNFFLTCNLSLECLENNYLRKLLKVKLPCSKAFTTTILPRVMKILKDLFSIYGPIRISQTF